MEGNSQDRHVLAICSRFQFLPASTGSTSLSVDPISRRVVSLNYEFKPTFCYRFAPFHPSAISGVSEMKLALVIFVLTFNTNFLFLGIASPVVLENSDFELPPSKWAPNATVPSVALNENNTIPGWTSVGAVQYVMAGPAVSLPRNNGHAILLAEDGNINQTFLANGDAMLYLLTFTLGMGGINCATNVSLVVSAPDSSSDFNVKQNYSKDPWETYATLLGSWGNGEPINLVLQSQTIDTGASNSTTCWPWVDNLLLKAVGLSSGAGGNNQDNLLSNGGFELGPAFTNGNAGVLLDSQPSITESALPDWSVMGTIRYIDSKSYFVPEGNAAVEIVSGDGAGIQTATTLMEGSGYRVEFMLGDANDSCIGALTVGAQAGSSVQNFTIQSKGTGSAMNYSMTFKAGSSPMTISFQSYTARQNNDGVFCGPVIDSVVLRASDGHISDSNGKFQLTMFLLTALLLQFNAVFF